MTECWTLNLQKLSFSYILSDFESHIRVGNPRPFVIREVFIFSSLFGFQTFPTGSIFISNASSFQSRAEIIFELFI